MTIRETQRPPSDSPAAVGSSPAAARRHSNRAILLLPFAVALCLRILPGERTIDDAYITFRYARNLADGLGLVYNAGEQVIGTTTPLYTLLMAALSLLLGTRDYPALSLWVNALADAVTCSLLIPLGETLSGRRRVGVAAGLLYAVAAFSVTFAIGGMETSVFVLLITSTALFYLRRRPVWALTGALAVLTRPDALIFIGPIALDFGLRWLLAARAALRSRAGGEAASSGLRAPLNDLMQPVLFFAVPLAPWILVAAIFYGTPLPHSIAAKTVAYQLNPTDGLVRLIQHYGTPFFEQATFEHVPLGHYWPLAGLILYTSLHLIGLLAFARRDSRSLSISLYPLVYFVVFAVANPLLFRWYLTPPIPYYFLGILGGVSQLAGGSKTRTAPRPMPAADSGPRAVEALRAQAPFLIPCLLFLIFSLRAWTLTPDHGPRRPAPDMAWFKLEQLYARVGRELAPRMLPETVVAAGDIGALGYFSRARILDTVGLISPQATRYYPLPRDQLVIAYAISADLVVDQKPDYVVFLEVYGRRTLLTDPRFLAQYALQEKIPTDIYGSDGMLIYHRKR